MKLESFAMFVDVPLVVTGNWYPCEGQKWSAKLDNCSTRNGSLIGSVTGFGDSPEAAMDHYAALIVGTTLTHNPYPYGTKEREIQVKCDFLAYSDGVGLISWAEQPPS